MSPASFIQRPIRWLRAISHYRATHSGGPNFAYDLCVQKFDSEECADLDLSTWGVAFCGAEPVRDETLRKFAATFEQYGFRRNASCPAYGLAESTLKVTSNTPKAQVTVSRVKAGPLERMRAVPVDSTNNDEERAQAVVGCGRASCDTVIRIVNTETLKECLPGEIGEIWVAGPSIARGYWNRPAETENTFRGCLPASGDGPFLRTGDLGFLQEGELFVTGRIKELVIIRGQNHYPADIESTVASAHPGLRSGFGAAFSVDILGEERLVVVQEVNRRSQFDMTSAARAIRESVVRNHELQVYAVLFVKAGSIPRTTSGKIQRNQCRTDFLNNRLPLLGSSILERDDGEGRGQVGRSEGGFVPVEPSKGDARPTISSYLTEIIAREFKLDPSKVDLKQSLAGLGVDSLRAMHLKNRLEADLSINVSITDLLSAITIVELAERLSGASCSVQRVSDQIATSSLSFEQERLWFLDQLFPGNASYNIGIAINIAGQLNLLTLEQSVSEIVRRHEATRSYFPAKAGFPVQLIMPPSSVEISLIDVSYTKALTSELIPDVLRQPFDLAQGPLFRLALLRLAQKEHVLIFAIHHIIADAWSLYRFAEELAALYENYSSTTGSLLPDLPVQYRDFVRWQQNQMQSEVVKHQLSYWRNHLSGAEGTIAVPTRRPQSTQRNFRAAIQDFSFSRDLETSLKLLSRQEGVTLFMTALTAFATLLYRCSGQSDFVIGSPIANRKRIEFEPLIGFFAFPLALRMDLSGNPTFRDALTMVRQTALRAYENQDVPFAKVVEIIRPERRTYHTPLFQVMFSLFRERFDSLQAGNNLTLNAFEANSGFTDLDMSLMLIEGTHSLRGTLTYRDDQFETAIIREIVDSYLQILNQCVLEPEKRLDQFTISQELETVAQRRSRRYTVAIAATFTAEPIEEFLSFWIKELNLLCKIEFAPYHQIFQQLLDPNSLFSTNQQGFNVILIRLEDWYKDINSQLIMSTSEDV